MECQKVRDAGSFAGSLSRVGGDRLEFSAGNSRGILVETQGSSEKKTMLI